MVDHFGGIRFNRENCTLKYYYLFRHICQNLSIHPVFWIFFGLLKKKKNIDTKVTNEKTSEKGFNKMVSRMSTTQYGTEKLCFLFDGNLISDWWLQFNLNYMFFFRLVILNDLKSDSLKMSDGKMNQILLFCGCQFDHCGAYLSWIDEVLTKYWSFFSSPNHVIILRNETK